MFAYVSYDAPADPTPLYQALGIMFGFFALVLVWPLVERLWSRWGESVLGLVDAAFDVIAEVSAPVARAVSRIASAVRYCLSPAAERRRQLGRYLASLPPHSGLTVYEEFEAEINALPPGAARAVLRHNFRMMMPKPSAACIEKARAMRGCSRVPEGYVRCLLRGEKPRCYSDVA